MDLFDIELESVVLHLVGKLLLFERLGVKSAAMNLKLADLRLKLLVALILLVLHCVHIIDLGIYFAKLA